MKTPLTIGHTRFIAARDRRRAAAAAAGHTHESGITPVEVVVMWAVMGLILIIGISGYTTLKHRKQAQTLAAETAHTDTTTATTHPSHIPWTTIFGTLALIVVAAILVIVMTTWIRGTLRNRTARLTARATVETKWAAAVTKHLTIKDAYGTLLCDPYQALTHSRLWDITEPRVAKFHEAYARVQDIHALHQHDCPTDPTLVDEYDAAVRTTTILWDAAVNYAARAGYNWMPPEDRKAARRAIAALRTMLNPAATDAERTLAAQRAKELIDTITVVQFKPETLLALDTTTRPALNPAPTPTEELTPA